MTLRLLITAIVLLLAGCDIPGMGADPKIAQREAEAKAIGGGCRYGLRSIEDCYSLNEGASKADMFTGWKDMDQYMRENKIEGIRATVDNTEPEEEIVEDKKPKAGVKEKPSETKPKSADKAGPKSTDKPVVKAGAH
ncbi:hypothetical protein [Rhodoferax sp. UBA5149]|uniref:hypothetical protein n=1 Tax=Rhodoferax sp. UBA5149 TaxID=1947379 RepID=UPI0025E68F47|nr:hypothetical protein [Rhodoferax sp. UBA5149]